MEGMFVDAKVEESTREMLGHAPIPDGRSMSTRVARMVRLFASGQGEGGQGASIRATGRCRGLARWPAVRDMGRTNAVMIKGPLF